MSLIKSAATQRKLFYIENPTNSIIWEMPLMQRVIQNPSTNKIDFHACMWGSSRNKKTSFLTNSTELESLRKTCAHQKWEHDSWGVKWGRAGGNSPPTSHRPKESKDPGTAAGQRQSAPPSGNNLGDTLAQRPYQKDNHQSS